MQEKKQEDTCSEHISKNISFMTSPKKIVGDQKIWIKMFFSQESIKDSIKIGF